MKKFVLVFLLQMIVSALNSYGQNSTNASVYLSNYTFSDQQPEIGYVKLRNNGETKIINISLSGKQAAAFKISKDHKLFVRPEKIKQGVNWLDLILTVKTSNGVLQDTFRLVHDHFIRNKVVAHRGAWKNTGATENSLAALKHAISLGCEGSEFDVHMSADSVLFVNHDPHIQNISIDKSTSEQLQQIKLPNGETLPTLWSYIETGTQQNKTKLILEIKVSELGKTSSLALTHKVVALIEKLKAEAWVDYISFDYDVCKEIMKIAPYAKVAYLNGDKTPAELAQNNFYGLDYHFSVLQKKPDWVKEAQQNKLTVNVWTVNDKALMAELLKEKVDFITTNEPELLLDLISGK